MTSVNVTSDALLRSLSKLKRDTLFFLCLKLQFVSDALQCIDKDYVTVDHT